LDITQDGTTIVIAIRGTADSIAIRNGVAAPGTTNANSRIETLAFADGTIVSADDIMQSLIDRQVTAGGDVITGFDFRDDALKGTTGDDLLSGGNGNDVYTYSAGDGSDIIEDRAGDPSTSTAD